MATLTIEQMRAKVEAHDEAEADAQAVKAELFDAAWKTIEEDDDARLVNLAGRIISDDKRGSTYTLERNPDALIDMCKLVVQLHEDLGS